MDVPRRPRAAPVGLSGSLRQLKRTILKPTENHTFYLLFQLRGRFSATLLGALGPTIAPEDCLGHSQAPLSTCWEPPRTAQERQGTHQGDPESPMASPRRLSMQPRSRFGAQVASQGPAQPPPYLKKPGKSNVF